MRLGILIGLVLLSAAPSASAQETAGSPRGRRLFDRVDAIIGDRVILRSTLDEEVEARQPGPIDAETRMRLRTEFVHDIVREQIWIQHGKSIGDKAPAAFAESIDKEVDRRIREEMRETGSFSLLDTELGQIGRSWDDVRRRERNQILERIARGNVMTKLYYNKGLMVTPREIQRYFDEHPEEFNRPASADVSWVSFRVRGDADAVLKQAQSAAAAWRTQNMSSAEVAEKFGGVDFGVKRDIRQTESDKRRKFLKTFAASGEIGDVSEPIRTSDSAIGILRLEDKVAARSSQFFDPIVQSNIRTRIARDKTDQWQNRVLFHKRRNVYVWPPTILPER